MKKSQLYAISYAYLRRNEKERLNKIEELGLSRLFELQTKYSKSYHFLKCCKDYKLLALNTSEQIYNELNNINSEICSLEEKYYTVQKPVAVVNRINNLNKKYHQLTEATNYLYDFITGEKADE